MPLTEPVPSKRVRDALIEGIADRIYPQRLYALEVSALARGRGLRAAKPQLWRFMATIAGHDVSCDVSEESSRRGPSMTSVSQGAHVAKARAAIRKAGALPEVKKKNFELRLLVIPALSVEAVWLKADDPAYDLTIPYLTGGARLKAMQPCVAAKFLDAIHALAARSLAFDDSPRRLAGSRPY